MIVKKLDKKFYLGSALDSTTKFIGKVLVHTTPEGRVTGVVYEVEA